MLYVHCSVHTDGVSTDSKSRDSVTATSTAATSHKDQDVVVPSNRTSKLPPSPIRTSVKEEPEIVSSVVAKEELEEKEKPSLPSKDLVEVEMQKGAVGLGFCIEGGKGSPLGDRPITVKRLFKGG